MRYFPLFLDLRGRRVLIRGGGETAAQKVRLFRRAQAELTVMWPELNDELAALAREGVLRHLPERDSQAEAASSYIVICASEGDPEGDEALALQVRRWGRVVNVVDRPDLCTAITPSLVDRDPVVVAIGTEGAAPVLGQRIKTLVESFLPASTGPFVAGLREMRPAMAERPPKPSPRAFWNWIMDGPRRRAEAGEVEAALAEVRDAIEAGEAPAASAPRLTLIELPAAADLLPLRAVRRLQEADLVCHPEDAPPEALELARRDAERARGRPLALAPLRALLAEGGAAVVLMDHAEMPRTARSLAKLGVDFETILPAAADGRTG